MNRHVLLGGLALSFLAACGSAAEDRFEVTMRTEQTASLGAASTARATLFAYDANIADAPATRLDSVTASVARLPARVALRRPEDEGQRVTPNSGSAAKICFHLDLVVDVDGDGQICPGDLRVDFARHPPAETCSIEAMEKDFVLAKVPAGERCIPMTAW